MHGHSHDYLSYGVSLKDVRITSREIITHLHSLFRKQKNVNLTQILNLNLYFSSKVMKIVQMAEMSPLFLPFFLFNKAFSCFKASKGFQNSVVDCLSNMHKHLGLIPNIATK